MVAEAAHRAVAAPIASGVAAAALAAARVSTLAATTTAPAAATTAPASAALGFAGRAAFARRGLGAGRWRAAALAAALPALGGTRYLLGSLAAVVSVADVAAGAMLAAAMLAAAVPAAIAATLSAA